MVTVTCEKTGIQFEAATKRTKNHPTIMAILNEANRYGWYSQALEAIKQGREAGYTTIEQFQVALTEAEAAYKEQRAVLIHKQVQEQREAKEARRQRYVTNELLRGRGYTWRKFENDEEDQDFFGAPEYEWTLYSPDNRPVSVQEAMQELAYQDVKFAKEWLADRNIVEEVPAIEKKRQAEQEEQQQERQFTQEQIAYQQEAIPALLEAGLSQEQAEQEAKRFSLPHSPLEDQVVIGSTICLSDGREVVPVINSDFRYGLLEGTTWWGIDEILLKCPDILVRKMLLEYSDRNKRAV